MAWDQELTDNDSNYIYFESYIVGIFSVFAHAMWVRDNLESCEY